MSKKHCSNCYYSGICDHIDICEDYMPFTEEIIDEEFDIILKDNRMAFYAEWFKYIEKCSS